MAIYQHTVPQRFDEGGHEVKPLRRHLGDGTFGKPLRCEECGKAIKEVDKNEGPEGLKALLRLW